MPTLAPNLNARRLQIKACWPDVTIGWWGDLAHQLVLSDHNEDGCGIVHAIDPMVTGDRAKAVVNECLEHPDDLQYVIHNRVIWSRVRNWAPKEYTGSNPHTDHVHISGRHGSACYSAHTGTGYNTEAASTVPVFNPCKTSAPATTPVTFTPPGPILGSRMLRVTLPLMRGTDVMYVQRFIGSRHCGAPDGLYGPTTAAGVRWYQRLRGIGVDGIVGPITWRNMLNRR